MTDQKNPIFEIMSKEGTLSVMPQGNLCKKAHKGWDKDPSSCALFRWMENYTLEDAKQAELKDVLEVQQAICAFCVKTKRVLRDR